MEQYISKDALVAEIERRMDDLYDYLPDASKVENGTITISEASNTGKYTALESFRDYIDTLEVKEEVTTTDAFIEKACEWIKEKWDDNYTMPIIIDSVIDEFKNYMKGE